MAMINCGCKENMERKIQKMRKNKKRQFRYFTYV